MAGTLKALRSAQRHGLQGSDLLKKWEGERGLLFAPLHSTVFKADSLPGGTR